jgi:transcriptional regulator with XRE-family HTH domain
MTHEELKSRALSNPSVKEEYDALDPEFNLLREMLIARQKTGLSQAEVAKRMGTKPPAVTRLESSLTSGKHSPSISTIKKYARALGYHLEIKLVQN